MSTTTRLPPVKFAKAYLPLFLRFVECSRYRRTRCRAFCDSAAKLQVLSDTTTCYASTNFVGTNLFAKPINLRLVLSRRLRIASILFCLGLLGPFLFLTFSVFCERVLVAKGTMVSNEGYVSDWRCDSHDDFCNTHGFRRSVCTRLDR